MNAIERSSCIIDAILADIGKSYRFTGGGGITAITQKATDTYMVSISQEERIDTLTYKAELDASGKVTLSAPVVGAE